MERAGPEDGLFRIEDDEDGGARVLPSELAGGPWNPAHQHGGAVTGLLTRAIDRIAAPVPMRVARITVEMFRGVPLTPLRIETRLLRAGRRIQSVEANLYDGETLVSRATGLRVRRDESLGELEASLPLDAALGQPPEKAEPHRMRAGFEALPGFIRAVDIVTDHPRTCGEPANLWARLRCRVAEGEPTPEIVRLATLVDFASGTGNAMDYTRFTSINPDLSIHVLREPRSEWLGLRGVTLRARDGIGQSLATVHDLEGPIARVQATLLLDRRPGTGS